MATYRQYCPIARASEILVQRWSPLIVRNLLFGASTFTEIANGVPHMSRSMLVKRLGQLERDGVLERRPKERGGGSRYLLTDAGRDLAGVLGDLAAWGERWAGIGPEHTDPGFALWAWCHVQLERDALPAGRTVVAFRFPEEKEGARNYWLLVEQQDAEVCYEHPGDEPAAVVVAGSRAFIDWHRGALTWADAVRSGAIHIEGLPSIVRSFPAWNTHHIDLGDAGAR